MKHKHVTKEFAKVKVTQREVEITLWDKPGSLRLPKLNAAIREREAELARLDGQLAELAEPIDERLVVLPSWVRQQVGDVVSLLKASREQAKAEFQRLKLAVTLHAVGTNGRLHYRADASAELPWLAGTAEFSGSAAGLSRPRCGRRSAGQVADER